jgi:hypothetical protein
MGDRVELAVAQAKPLRFLAIERPRALLRAVPLTSIPGM